MSDAKKGQHAPGPLKSCGCGHCGLIWATTADLCIAIATGPHDEEQPLPRDFQQANAAEIVHRWNAHEALIAALEECVRTLCVASTQPMQDAGYAAFDAARAALARARGGK